jgi:DNA replication and repair protein RecF
VPIKEFTATDFRCLRQVELNADPEYNLIYGPNAAGKTSILEALGYLGRGRSFRGAPVKSLIRHGNSEFVLFGRVVAGSRESTVGVRNSADGLEVHVNGESRNGAAALAEALPLQIIEPNVHNLVGGPPDERRRYLDWLAFHVEHGFLTSWRQFRRALKQRNAALRSGAPAAAIRSWDVELAERAAAIDRGRRRALLAAESSLQAAGADLLDAEVRFEYRQGWNEEKTLLEALEAGLERERQVGSTQSGPHRADLKIVLDAHQARRLVSRGQQKLLACAMILAATESAQAALGRPLLLLLDDPAAELDEDSLRRLMRRVNGLGCQVIATSLAADTPIFSSSAKLFHVEHGNLTEAG